MCADWEDRISGRQIVAMMQSTQSQHGDHAAIPASRYLPPCGWQALPSPTRDAFGRYGIGDVLNQVPQREEHETRLTWKQTRLSSRLIFLI